MASDELKEMIVESWLGRDTSEKDWKRISKKKMNGTDVRTFENSKTGDQVWTFGDADDECMHPAGTHLFFLAEGPDPWEENGADVIQAAFNPESYWTAEKCLWDQHLGFLFDSVFQLPDWIELDEACENSFIVTVPAGKTILDVEVEFRKAGLIFDQDFHDFMISCR